MQTRTEPSRIWAKSPERGDITLRDHTQHVLDAFEGLKDRVDPPKLQELIRLAILCHDFGKVLPAFQTRTLGHKEYKPFRVEPNPPHSLISVLWMNQEKLTQIIAEKIGGANPAEAESYTRFVVSAVAYHHWRESFNELIRYGDTPLGRLCEQWTSNGDVEILQHNLENELASLDLVVKDLLCFNREMAEGVRNGAPFSRYVIPPYQLYWLPARIPIEGDKMREWVLIAGFLMRCDHFASFAEKEGDGSLSIEMDPITSATVENNIAESLKKPKEEIWQVGKAAVCKNQNTILVAPTGYGKTEFAFLWSSGEKFFYTLPLRSAVNQIFDRTTKAFASNEANEHVGLLHSDADVYLIGDGAESENLMVYDLSKQMSFPVIISTGDQFFPYALRPPGYEKIFATFSYSKLVIDEVQAYDPRAAAIVVKFIEHVVRMGGKFLLMTATLPQFVRKALEETLATSLPEQQATHVDIYEENKKGLEELYKHKLQWHVIDNNSQGKYSFEIPDEQLEFALSRAHDGKRVLVILNTVKQAQNVYKRLKENADEVLKNRIWLLHSRFTLAERKAMELDLCGDKQRIKRREPGEFENPNPNTESVGKILVATQVVEASLDIDADIMFTELAPMDSLVQRMGRVLRRIQSGQYKTNETNVFIWAFSRGWESGNGRVYDKELLYKTARLLQYSEKCEKYSEKCEKYSEKCESAVSELKDIGRDVKWGDVTIEYIPAGNVNRIEKHSRKRKQSTEDPKKADKPGGENIKVSAENVVLLSEYQKYLLVKCAYDSLASDGTYLMKFYQTLELLDAGYMSDRKEEAQKMFREIATIDVIPFSQQEDFSRSIIEFFKGSSLSKRPYTVFKKEILVRFIVQTPRHRGIDLNRYRLEHWLDELQGIDRQTLDRLKSWCRDVYFLDYEYEKGLGIVYDPSRIKDDSPFI